MAALDHLRTVFDPDAPRPLAVEGARAAVAAVFRDGDRGTELLFIERAARAGDPWSGQMAMPGGRVEPQDVDAASTAMRETREELGLDLGGAVRLGRLAELHGGVRAITVSAHGFWLPGERPLLRPNVEVADALWIPLDELAEPERAVAYDYPQSVREQTVFPGIAISGGRVVWGLTLRLLQDLFTRLGRPLSFPV